MVKKCLNSNQIKIIALILMLVDHIGGVLIENGILNFSEFWAKCALFWFNLDYTLRFIGRISFPLFCYFIVEGFLHTKNIKKYFIRILIFAFISEIPFDLAFHNSFFYLGYQNVLFEFALAVLLLWALSKNNGEIVKQGIIVFIFCILSYYFRLDYDYIGILLIVVFYLFRNDKSMMFLLSGVLLMYSSKSFFCISVFSLLIINMYNGFKGKLNIKYLFYLFYPIHLVLLVFIRFYILGIYIY